MAEGAPAASGPARGRRLLVRFVLLSVALDCCSGYASRRLTLRLPPVPHPRSGGGGPCEAWWRGQASRPSFAPSTASGGPPPPSPATGEDTGRDRVRSHSLARGRRARRFTASTPRWAGSSPSALGLHRKSRAIVFVSLVPILIGHALSIGIVLYAAIALGVFLDERLLYRLAGLVLIAWAPGTRFTATAPRARRHADRPRRPRLLVALDGERARRRPDAFARRAPALPFRDAWKRAHRRRIARDRPRRRRRPHRCDAGR